MHNRTIAILGSLALSAGLLFAQATGADQQQPAQQTGQSAQMRHRHGPGMQAQWLTRKLNLSQEQAAQLKRVLAGEHQQMQTLRADTSQTVQDFRTKAQAIRQDTNSKIEALLDDTQKQQYEQMLAARRSHRQQQPAQQQAQPGL